MVYTAVGCLGIPALSDLVNEVLKRFSLLQDAFYAISIGILFNLFCFFLWENEAKYKCLTSMSGNLVLAILFHLPSKIRCFLEPSLLFQIMPCPEI